MPKLLKQVLLAFGLGGLFFLAFTLFLIAAIWNKSDSTSVSSSLPNLGRSTEIPPIDKVLMQPSSEGSVGNLYAPRPTESPLVIPLSRLFEWDKNSPDITPSSQTESSDITSSTPETPVPTPTHPRLFPVRLEIPSANISTRVLQSTLDKDQSIYVPTYDAGHYIASARPGEKNNMVIVGHSRRGLVFHNLSKVKLGDIITIYDETNQQFDYKVAQIELVPVLMASEEQIKEGLQYIWPTNDERITLVTCWPDTDYANRLMVIGIPLKQEG